MYKGDGTYQTPEGNYKIAVQISGEWYYSNVFAISYGTVQPTEYIVSYNANGGEGAPDAQTKLLDVDLKLSDVEPTRNGFRFKGWSTSADGAVAYAPGATYSENANLTLYAVWEAINYGDLTGDGDINAVDAVLLAQKIAGWDVDCDELAADCNGDDIINAVDAVLLAQYLAGWDVSLG
ncbi:MAG: InlB B-repeat-containing protein [Clostridia bacterium]|nr:InlB B-repeat-containing protein [Clostridia bacterium]